MSDDLERIYSEKLTSEQEETEDKDKIIVRIKQTLRIQDRREE